MLKLKTQFIINKIIIITSIFILNKQKYLNNFRNIKALSLLYIYIYYLINIYYLRYLKIRGHVYHHSQCPKHSWCKANLNQFTLSS